MKNNSILETVLVVLDGREDFADKIMGEINNLQNESKIILEKIDSQKFSDGELSVNFENSIRGKRVYILTSPINSDEIIKLNLAISAAKRAAATEIIPIIPFFPYQRSDKKDQLRGAIGAKIMAEMIEQRGATGLITFDLHADQIQGFFNIPLTHLEGKNVFDDYLFNKISLNGNIILSSCDLGGVKRVKRMVTRLKERYNLDINYVVIDKIRDKANSVESITIIGNVNNKDVIIIDDMIDTFGSADKAVDGLINAGAKSVNMIASHGILSGPALGRLENSKLVELIITDSLNFNKKDIGKYKIKVVSLATQIAYAIFYSFHYIYK